MSADAVQTLVYLHGFMGSSQSLKARQTCDWMRERLPQINLWVPDLPYSPAAVIDQVSDKLDTVENAVFIGSSMGGFYANYFSERRSERAVMINPAVYPHNLLQDYVGIQKSPYTGECFEFHPEYLDQLQALVVEEMKEPELRMVLLQSGDETLDYREAEAFYNESECVVEQGGNHSFTDFPRYLPEIAHFLFDV